MNGKNRVPGGAVSTIMGRGLSGFDLGDGLGMPRLPWCAEQRGVPGHGPWVLVRHGPD